MSRKDPFMFPSGVTAGRPFESPEAAVVWLNSAVIAGTAPVDFSCRDAMGRTGVWTVVPRVAIDAPRTLAIVSAGEEWTVAESWNDAVARGKAEPITAELVSAHASNAAVGGPCNPPIVEAGGQTVGFMLSPGVVIPGYFPSTVAMGQVRILAGWEAVARERLAVAKRTGVDRRGSAWSLGQHESALGMAREDFLMTVNRWVSTTWADCVNEGRNVSPNPLSNPESINPRAWSVAPNPAGLVRVGLN